MRFQRPGLASGGDKPTSRPIVTETHQRPEHTRKHGRAGSHSSAKKPLSGIGKGRACSSVLIKNNG